MESHSNESGHAAQPQSQSQAVEFTGVQIQRDYSQGLSCKFEAFFPPQLAGKIDSETFEATMNNINALFKEAEEIDLSQYLFSCLSCLTAFACFAFVESKYSKVIKKLDLYLREENERKYHPAGLHIVSPTRNGLRVLDIRPFFAR